MSFHVKRKQYNGIDMFRKISKLLVLHAPENGRPLGRWVLELHLKLTVNTEATRVNEVSSVKDLLGLPLLQRIRKRPEARDKESGTEGV